MAPTTPRPREAAEQRPTLAARLWLALSTAFAAVSGLLPHVLHHAGPFAGAALLGGAAGSVLFGLLGLLAAIPFLLRLHARTGGWRLPGIALATFAAAFAISSFVIGPQINGDDDGGQGSVAAPAATERPAGGGGPASPADGDAGADGAGGGHASHH